MFAELGADVIPIGCSPNGRNINVRCGSTHPELLQATVRGVGAPIGIALDGDGDRVVMVDENGALVDGDQLIHLLAMDALERGHAAGAGGGHGDEQSGAAAFAGVARYHLPARRGR